MGVAITAFGAAIGLDVETVSQAGAVVMAGFGLVLLVPRLSAGFATATGGLASRADATLGSGPTGATGQFLAGLLLGAVWSPCIGPTLGGAIGLASQGKDLVWAAAVMAAFALGVSTLILGIGFGARGAILHRQATLRRVAAVSRPILGAALLFVGVAILLGWHHVVEIWALDTFPPWLTDLSVRY